MNDAMRIIAPGESLPPMKDATIVDTLDQLRELRDLASEHKERDIAPSTRRYYDGDWDAFVRWCNRMNVAALPVDPEIVGLYITDLARTVTLDGEPAVMVSTLRRYVAAISRINYENGGGRGLGEHPEVTRVLGGLSRQRQEAHTPRAPLLRDDVARIIDAMDHSSWPAGVTSARDTLAFLLGFASALRRSNVAALTVDDLVVNRQDGLHLHIGRSKTDQEGRGALLAIPYGQHPVTCTPCAWHRWAALMAATSQAERMRLVLNTPTETADWQHVCRDAFPQLPPETPVLARVTKGGHIRLQNVTGNALYERIKVRAEEAGYDPTQYGYHSLRAGFVTQALMNGADKREVRKQTLHKTDTMVDHYDRDYLPLRGNAVTRIGL